MIGLPLIRYEELGGVPHLRAKHTISWQRTAALQAKPFLSQTRKYMISFESPTTSLTTSG